MRKLLPHRSLKAESRFGKVLAHNFSLKGLHLAQIFFTRECQKAFLCYNP